MKSSPKEIRSSATAAALGEARAGSGGGTVDETELADDTDDDDADVIEALPVSVVGTFGMGLDVVDAEGSWAASRFRASDGGETLRNLATLTRS